LHKLVGVVSILEDLHVLLLASIITSTVHVVMFSSLW